MPPQKLSYQQLVDRSLPASGFFCDLSPNNPLIEASDTAWNEVYQPDGSGNEFFNVVIQNHSTTPAFLRIDDGLPAEAGNFFMILPGCTVEDDGSSPPIQLMGLGRGLYVMSAASDLRVTSLISRYRI